MLKNGRPYSMENGYVDDGLISEKDYEVVEAVSAWIKDNLRPSKRILEGRTSYGLKHMLEDDTKIYLTNNEFKDALLLAGYCPVDADELNWRYRMELVRECNDNPGPFFKWAVKNFAAEDSPRGDFAKDMAGDRDFPVMAEKGIITSYLHRTGACEEALEAFGELWRLYEGEED